MHTIGFIGTGVMGKSMVRNLMKAGFEVSVYNRSPESARLLASEGAIFCQSIAECAQGKDAVITIVGYPADVEQVYFGSNGILESAANGTYLIDMTTTSPKLSQEIYAAACKKNMHALDAPVSGGDTGAKNGTLAIMVGGDKADFDACLPVFQAMGQNIVHEGASGSGQHVKMANQIVIAGTIMGVAEAVAYTKAMGVSPDTMLKTIGTGAAGSWQLNNLGPKMAVDDFTPGFFVKHFVKDMKIALEESKEHGLDLDILPQVYALFEELERTGHAQDGTQSIYSRYSSHQK